MGFVATVRKKTNQFHIDITLDTNKGVTGLLGASGSGKSLFLKCLAGLEKPDEGEIILDGKILFSSEKKIDLPSRERQVAYLFQSYALFPNMTALENIKICAKKKSIDDIISLCRIKNLLDQYPNKLSGGERQRVAIARILASNPRVILLDEPFSALDTALKIEMEREMLNTISNFDGHVYMVSHNATELYRFSKDIAVVDHGRIIECGAKGVIYNTPTTTITAKLIGYDNIIEIDSSYQHFFHLSSPKGYHCFKSSEVMITKQGAHTGEIIDWIDDPTGYIVYIKLPTNHIIKVFSKDQIIVGSMIYFQFSKNPLIL